MSFWPAWTRTLDSMIASLIDRSDPCAVVGCGGGNHYLGAPATGVAYHVLVADPGLPFRSRWQGMVPIVSAPLPSRAPAAVVELHPHIAVGADERIS